MAKATVTPIQYGGHGFASVFIQNWSSALSLLGSQFAGWQVKGEKLLRHRFRPSESPSVESQRTFWKAGLQRGSQMLQSSFLENREKTYGCNYSIHCGQMQGLTKQCLCCYVFDKQAWRGPTQVSGRIVETGTSQAWEAWSRSVDCEACLGLCADCGRYIRVPAKPWEELMTLSCMPE